MLSLISKLNFSSSKFDRVEGLKGIVVRRTNFKEFSFAVTELNIELQAVVVYKVKD